MLMRFDPFQELDRMFGTVNAVRSLPMDVYRRGEEYVVEFDVPGLEPDSIDVTVERNVLQIEAERRAGYGEGDQVLVAERPQGRVTRQVHLGNDVDGDAIRAEYRDGVLTIHVPVADAAKPHKIEVAAGKRQQTLEAQTA